MLVSLSLRLLLKVKTACHVPCRWELYGFVLGRLHHAVSRCSVPSGKFQALEVRREGGSVASAAAELSV